jgi:hypothetical protein
MKIRITLPQFWLEPMSIGKPKAADMAGKREVPFVSYSLWNLVKLLRRNWIV